MQNKTTPKPNRSPDSRRPGPDGAQPPRGILAGAIILAMLGLMAYVGMKQKSASEEIPYAPNFVELVEEGQVAGAEIVEEATGITYVRGRLKTEPGHKPRRFKVYIRNSDKIEEFLRANGVPFSVPPQSPILWQIASSVLPILLIVGILYFIFMRQMRNAGSSALSFGKSRARRLTRDRKKITFEDVAGIDEAREEVEEIIEFLKDPKKFQKLGGRIPKGVMLMGPPGTGKTLLAKAIAGQADVPFFSISGSDFVEMFVGVGASRVRDMFEQGKKNAPCIIFIDEIDAVGRSRFSGIGGGHDEREQTLNALLVEMDGFDTQEGVIIIAATNRPDVLDPALLRPGRFDRQIVIDLPNLDGREKILRIHARSIKLAGLGDLRRIARGTPGFSGADLENLMNEAALLAARRDKPTVELADLEEARDKVMWGRERRSRVMDETEKRNTAYHEAGHALVQQVIEHAEPLHKVTIIPRGMYLGATMSLPDKDRFSESKAKLQSQLSVLMGGRAAEELMFGDITNGSRNDLKTATRIARFMICDWGMSENLGPQTFGENQELMFLGRDITRSQDYSQDTATRIDVEVNALLRKCHERARDILTARRDKLEMIAGLLLERETLDGREVEEIVTRGRIFTEAERIEIEKRKRPAAGEKDESSKPNDLGRKQSGASGSPAIVPGVAGKTTAAEPSRPGA
ncbi:MAG: ATP-dependent zinc metalloprotease FtsH [Verrucomicrobiota bacterium]|nr:ATP-dependent zinc metalloprotease FtsH [Verrucomicrobiota bacterium]